MSTFGRLTLLVLLCLPGVVSAQSTPPATPSSPSPANGATGVSTTPTLTWAQDPNARSYDVYLGTSPTPPLVGSANKNATYTPGTLASGTTYYWKVDAKGTGGSVTRGPVWTFTTASASTSPPPPPSATTALRRLKLVTWNIQGGHDASSLYAIDSQVALLADINADVIGLHELSGSDQAAQYKSKLEAATGITWHAVWAPIPSTVYSGGNLVLSRLPIISSSIKELDAAPNDSSWGGAKRSAARVELDVNSRRVNVFFTHLDTDFNIRSAQLKMLLDWVKTFSAPRLVGGDFNMMPEEGDYATMTGQFDDAWHTLVERFQGWPGPDKGYTKNVRGIAPYVGQPGRIDYWFHERGSSTVVPTEIAVLETQRSDHHAVVMWVRVQ